ncbi:MAG: ABC transporter permease [Actinomycetota bacterium]|nr:ABC transporter permease [Actinomycetota bacterium]
MTPEGPDPGGGHLVPPGPGADRPDGALVLAPAPPRAGSRLRWIVEANVVVVTALAIVSSLVLGGVLIIATSPTVLHALAHIGSHPGRALGVAGSTVGDAYAAIFTGAIVSPTALGHAITTGHGWTGVLTPISETLVSATPLVLAGLGVAIGFGTGVFNIGAQGQLIAGALAALYVGFAVHLPIGIHLPLVVLAGALGGAVAGFIPGYLKARTGAHEVISTIMLNYVFLNLLNELLTTQPFQQPGQSNAISRTIPTTARLPHLFGSGLRANLGFVIAVVCVLGASWFTRRSTAGFAFRVIGSNPKAGRTAGIDVRKVTTAVLALSGALAGLAGMATLSGTDFFLSSGYGGNIGFDAITVALLGRNRPVGVFLGALLFAALDTGGRNMQAATGIPLDLAFVIQAIIVFFVATPSLVREIYRLRESGASIGQVLSKGWGG